MMELPRLLASRARGWVRVLLDLRFAFEIRLQGFPGWLRLPEGWDVAQAPQAEHLFYFVAEGGFAARIGRRELAIGPGDLLWVPAGVGFHFWLPPGKALQVYRFRLHPRNPRAQAPAGRNGLVFPAAWPCQTWLRQIVEEASHRDSYQAERLRGLLVCLFTELARLGPASRRRPGRFTRAQQEGLLRFFAARSRARPGPVDLAAHLGLSPDYFTRVFRRTFGQAPRRWLVEQRIRLAGLRLLESKLNVSQVADEFGYESLFLFSRQFKAVLGVSPVRYRRQHAETAAVA